MSYGRHFPIEDSNHAGLRLVEDHVVDFVVAVNEGAPVQWLRALLREEVHHVVEVREFSDGFFGVGVDDGRLCFGDCLEGRDLAVEEACRFAEGFESDAFAVDAVELRERLYCILPAVCLSVGGTGWGCLVSALEPHSVTYSAFLSSPLTPGIAGSVKCRPSRNSMM